MLFSSSPGSENGADPSGVLQPDDSPLSILVGDERIDFIKELAFKYFKLKAEKWNRFVSSEDNQWLLLAFLESAEQQKMLLFSGSGGTLHATDQLVSGSPQHNEFG